MMMPAIKYCVLIFIVNYSFILGQETLKEQYEYSLELFKQERYFDAVTELKRLNFFDNEKIYSFESNLLIGKSYKEGGKYSDALKYFVLSEINARSDSEFFEAKISQARVNILRRTTQQSLKLLDQLQSSGRFAERYDEIQYWRGWTYIFADEWDKAGELFAELRNDSVKNICMEVSSDKYNVTTAKALSYVIPGAGQIYTGHYMSGLLSLGWNALWGYLTVKSFIDERIFDGLVTGNFLWLRFYVGSIQNAEKFAQEENLSIANKALYYLQYQYKGEKP
jgi:tetratricopeptide (TPR) repeat protein